MFELSEIITLSAYLLFFLYLVFFVRLDRPMHRYTWFYGILCLLLAMVVTILEGLFLPDLLNMLEHISMTAATILFLAGIIRKEL